MNTNIISLSLTRQIMAFVAMLAMVMSLVPMQSFADHDPFGGVPQTSVQLCHSGNGKNFVQNSPNITATGANINLAGHEGHSHDIIPPFYFDTGTEILSYPGKNWPAGESVWENGCKTPNSGTGSITVVKAFSGEQGPKSVSDFTLEVDGEEVTSGASNELVASKGNVTISNYVISESKIPSDYEIVSVSCVDKNNGVVASGVTSASFELSNNDDITCTITNTWVDPNPTPDTAKLKIVKNVVGGSATASDWTMSASASAPGNVYNFTDSGDSTVAVFNTVAADVVYAMGETSVITSGYTLTNISCDGGVVSGAGNDITLAKDEQVTCTFTNTADNTPTGTLDVKKEIIGNPNFTPDDFEFLIDGVATTSFDVTGTNSITKEVGVYTVTEVPVSGFNTTYDSCVDVSVTEGQTSTCTITNTWIPTCSDGIQNQDETGVDTGGVCDNGGGGPTLCDDVSAQNYGEEGTCVFYVSQCVSPDVNLLQNGSFEEPVVTNSSNWQIFPVVSGWLIELSDGLELWKGLGIGPSEGIQNAELDGNDATKITQSTTTIPGATYELRFDFAARTANADDNHIEATVDGVSEINVSTDNTNWVTYGTTFVADDASTDISFVDLGTPQSNGGTGTLLDNAVLCLVNDPTIVTYFVEGYVWEDENENGEWDGEFSESQEEESTLESSLSGWKVNATNGVDEYSTTTDSNGYYYFNPPAGTWTITEEVQSEWAQTFPGSGSHVVTVPEVSASTETQSLFAAVFDLIVPTAHAQVAPTTYGPYNFGNVFVGTTVVTTGGGGGGGSRATPVDRGTPAPLVAGDATSGTPATLPAPLVLGEQVSAVPTGAPATGHGGTSATTNTNILTLSQILYGNRRFDLVK